ncbi:histidine kinase [Marivirga harenae]|uniref:sensor histidine kinase n=1 Tax=Marivirga harenae TaxID=2010992 RepID=UPI0026DF5C15|nr:histidine kinase [Marivirga harenae]WKV13745.1 histidine kinase [Marivirga harenae]|tara:strand:+ start:33138 stop:34646 length:1509 start_codon:yes stop_codon:yes gene_type:complete
MYHNQINGIDFVNIGFLGIMFFVLLYALGVYFYEKKAIYFYYSLYIFVLGIYLFSRSEFIYISIISEIEAYFPRINFYISDTFQYIAHFAALQFGILFLNAKKDYPIFFRAAYFVRIIFFLAVGLSILNISTFNNMLFNDWLSYIERTFATLATVYMQIVILIQSKNRLVIFYMVGSILFLLGAVISVFALDVIYMRIGTLLEILLFSLGLAYRSNLIQNERNIFKERMISEIQEKEELLNTYNEDLKRQVLERSEALIAEQQLFEREKQKVLKLSLEKEIDRVKMTALRSQMKPHFLFNALNAIRALIIKNDSHQAYDYLTDFSRLVRYILESSENDYVSLEEELKMLKIYVRIERMRADSSFDYSVHVDRSINARKLSIPPLILQPFLENAIVHGVDMDKPNQVLSLKISLASNSLIKFEVQDNGKGRNKNIKEKRYAGLGKKKSMAVDLTQKRLDLLDSDRAKLEIKDLYLDDGAPGGTKVVLYLPLISYGKKTDSNIS